MLLENRTCTASLALLNDTLARIKAASERFDQGSYTEALSLAGHLSALLHRTADAGGLIDRLGLHDELTWVDTAGVPNPKTTCSTAGLTLMRIRSRHRGAGEFVPKLAMYPPVPIRTRGGGHINSGSRIPFDHWWTNPVVKDADGGEYSRKHLVLALCESHDPESEAAHEALRGSASLGWIVDDGAAAKPLRGSPVIASVRQIGYEVLQSITEQRTVIDAAA